MSKVSNPSDEVDQSKQVTTLSCFGPRPLIDGEDAREYDELLLQFSTAIKPADFLEEMFLHDVLDLTWELLRWRRVQTHLISDRIAMRIRSVLEKRSVETKDINVLVAHWKAQDPKTISLIKEYLVLGGETIDSIAALEMDSVFNSLSAIEGLTARLETRRNAVFREIDRHRATFAQKLRSTIKDVEDGEFQTIEQKAITKSAA